MDKEKSTVPEAFVDYEVIHDSIGVTHFLPPKRCRNCED
jgi:hypothetical protein